MKQQRYAVGADGSNGWQPITGAARFTLPAISQPPLRLRSPGSPNCLAAATWILDNKAWVHLDIKFR